MEERLNRMAIYVAYGMLAVAITLSQIVTVEFARGIIEIALAIASFTAYQRSRSEIISNITLLAFFVLLIMGLYDLNSAFGLIEWPKRI